MKAALHRGGARHRRRPQRPRPHLRRPARPRPRDPEGDGRHRRRHQPRAAVRRRLRGLLPLRAAAWSPARAKADVADSAVGARVGIGPNERRRLRPRRHARGRRCPASTRPRPRQLVDAGAPGLPVLQRHPRQHRRRPRDRLSAERRARHHEQGDPPRLPPARLADPENFRLVEVERARAGPGQILVRNMFMSVDPYMRGPDERRQVLRAAVPARRAARRRRGRRGRRVRQPPTSPSATSCCTASAGASTRVLDAAPRPPGRPDRRAAVAPTSARSA